MKSLRFLVFLAIFPLWQPGQSLGEEASAPASFSQMDANQDGSITQDEFLAFHSVQLKQAFAALDSNQNQALEREELELVETSKGPRFQLPTIINVSPERKIHAAKSIAGSRGPTSPISRRIRR